MTRGGSQEQLGLTSELTQQQDENPWAILLPLEGWGWRGPCICQVSAETAHADLSYPCKCCGTGLGIAHTAGQCSTDASTVRRLKRRGKTDWKKKENTDLEIEIAFYFNLEMKNIHEYFYTDCFLNKISL